MNDFTVKFYSNLPAMLLSMLSIVILSAFTVFFIMKKKEYKYKMDTMMAQFKDKSEAIKLKGEVDFLKARYDEIRGYYEEKVFDLQNKLQENEKRWQDANHLIIDAQSRRGKSTKPMSEQVLQNFGITEDSLAVTPRSIFVLTPFIDEEYDTYQTIKDTCSQSNWSCTRGDEAYREKEILSHILISIAKASIVIANINGRNPNVFYELGICHSIGKPVIIISKHKEQLPFDVQGKSIVFYNNNDDLKEKIKQELLKITEA